MSTVVPRAVKLRSNAASFSLKKAFEFPWSAHRAATAAARSAAPWPTPPAAPRHRTGRRDERQAAAQCLSAPPASLHRRRALPCREAATVQHLFQNLPERSSWPGEVQRFLRKHSHPAAEQLGPLPILQPSPKHGDLPAIGPRDAADSAQHRRLPRAVAAHHREQRPLRHGQRPSPAAHRRHHAHSGTKHPAAPPPPVWTPSAQASPAGSAHRCGGKAATSSASQARPSRTVRGASTCKAAPLFNYGGEQGRRSGAGARRAVH